MECPDENALVAFMEARLGAAELQAIEDHVDACDECRRVLVGATTAAGPTMPGEEGAAQLSHGETVGRYVVLKRLGAGGMGVVYAAYDPELDRRIALKLLKADQGENVAARKARLLREAQALARLSHPNVTQIYDVGLYEERVFIATELVTGTTLREWVNARPRSTREILRVFREAGEGLSAAHRAGLVHRDFKPDNVMVGEDGSVRVTDFGLARSAQDAVADAASPAAPVPTPSTLAQQLTEAGATVGTPAYMAPEQLRGGAADERSDQYSFCVSFHEALHGFRPADRRAKDRGVGHPRPRVPGWLSRIIQKGLRESPSERHGSMATLLEVLADAENRHLISGVAVMRLIGLFAWIATTLLAVAKDQKDAAEQLPTLIAYVPVAIAILLAQSFSRQFRSRSHFAIPILDVPFVFWSTSRLVQYQVLHGHQADALYVTAIGLAVFLCVVVFSILSLDPRVVATTAAVAIVLQSLLTLKAAGGEPWHVAILVAPLLVVGAVGTITTYRIRSSTSKG